MSGRPYTLRQRAETQQATRARIIEAAMALHEQLGPAQTTISAIAERAGVQRLTVYRHFPDDAALFQACTSTWIERHPPPDPASWAGIPDAGTRLRVALRALYGYYRATHRMWTVSFRDEAEVQALREPMQGFRAYLEAIRGDLLAALPPPPGERARLVRATLGHALSFQAWASLAEREALDDDAMAGLVAGWVTSTATAADAGTRAKRR